MRTTKKAKEIGKEMYDVSGQLTILARFPDNARGLDETVRRTITMVKEVDAMSPWKGTCPVSKREGSMYGNCPYGNADDYIEIPNGYAATVRLTVKPIDMSLTWSRTHAYGAYLHNLARRLVESQPTVTRVAIEVHVKSRFAIIYDK